MKTYCVCEKEFAPYGKIITGYDTKELLDTLTAISPKPADGVIYIPGDEKLEALPIAKELADNVYGGMPIQIGYCNGYNTKLNCVEYHRDSEVNVSPDDFILLLALREDIEDGKLDSSKVKAFKVPAGVMVEVYATALHYAPCTPEGGDGVRVIVVLPRGTNGPKPEIVEKGDEDKMLFACNKWLLAHEDTPEAKSGAVVGITGKNLDITVD